MTNNLIELTRRNDIEGVKKFISEGGDINLQNENGKTALMIASYWDFFEIAEILLQAGADKDIQDKWGKTALDYAKEYLDLAQEYDYQKIIELLTTKKTTNGK